MSHHPTPFRLEAWHAGEVDEEVARHVESCAACRAQVDALAEAHRVFLAREEPTEFVRRVAARARQGERAPRRAWFSVPRAAGLAAALGVAVALVLVFLPHRTDNGVDTIRLKGNPVTLAVVVKHAAGEAQTRHAGTLVARPGDELRVEVTLARPAVLTVGVLEDDGKWLPLAEEVSFPAGVHYLRQSLRLDQHPTTAWLIAGSPDGVRRAVRERTVEQVVHLRITTGRIP